MRPVHLQQDWISGGEGATDQDWRARFGASSSCASGRPRHEMRLSRSSKSRVGTTAPCLPGVRSTIFRWLRTLFTRQPPDWSKPRAVALRQLATITGFHRMTFP